MDFIKRFFADSTTFISGDARSIQFIKVKREKVCKARDIEVHETSYADIMQRLVRRYLFKRERERDSEGKIFCWKHYHDVSWIAQLMVSW
ncbi:unnamed protein product [Schistocephalus solidus]|uniref:DUF2087 domain-containing protein n=1 Tax=Schistocephalus solidus TaxID=70667 RepID=A0A183TJQ2_SCHSO|nr:unnamed protein product [Schistocephalus solidus]